MTKRTIKKSVQVLRYLRAQYDADHVMTTIRATNLCAQIKDEFGEHLAARDISNHFVDRRYRLEVKRLKMVGTIGAIKAPGRSPRKVRSPRRRHKDAVRPPTRLAICTVPNRATSAIGCCVTRQHTGSHVDPRIARRNDGVAPPALLPLPSADSRSQCPQSAVLCAQTIACLPRCSGYYTIAA